MRPPGPLSCFAQDFLKANGFTNEDLVEAVKKQQAENPDGTLGLDTGLTDCVRERTPAKRRMSCVPCACAPDPRPRAPPRPSSCAVGVILATLEYYVFLQMISDAKTRFAD